MRFVVVCLFFVFVCLFVLLSLSVVFRCVGGYASNTHMQSVSLSLSSPAP